jgi:hypothetical protein
MLYQLCKLKATFSLIFHLCVLRVRRITAEHLYDSVSVCLFLYVCACVFVYVCFNASCAFVRKFTCCICLFVVLCTLVLLRWHFVLHVIDLCYGMFCAVLFVQIFVIYLCLRSCVSVHLQRRKTSA